MDMELKKRIKKPSFWLAAFALIYFITKTWFKYEIPGYSDFVTLVMGAFAAWGIIEDYKPEDQSQRAGDQ